MAEDNCNHFSSIGAKVFKNTESPNLQNIKLKKAGVINKNDKLSFNIDFTNNVCDNH